MNILSSYFPVNNVKLLCNMKSCYIGLHANTPLTCYSQLPTEKKKIIKKFAIAKLKHNKCALEISAKF